MRESECSTSFSLSLCEQTGMEWPDEEPELPRSQELGTAGRVTEERWVPSQSGEPEL